MNLASASTANDDILDLIHNRTGHGNKNMLMECVKSKIVKWIKITESQIRKLHNLIITCAKAAPRPPPIAAAFNIKPLLSPLIGMH